MLHIYDLLSLLLSDGSVGTNDTTDNMSTISSATEIGTSDASDIEIATDEDIIPPPSTEGNTVRQRTATTIQQ